ncbi:MAG TPA: ribosome assembly factor SBDS, partial [Candidatus Thalassarchaeaceae archaeon]|nr:ribosome assembly factor SBDS [Candidatus Thalassarchaeaceae archaeon]
MVSLDDAVIARLEKGGNRYEILVDPELVTKWKRDRESVDFEEMLATDEVWSDVKSGDRPTEDALLNIFGTTDLQTCVEKILIDGSIQLTTVQRKKMVEEKRKQIIHSIASTATDPKTKGPHPPIRIENALDEARFSVDPFLSVERQVADAVQAIRPLIPLQFITVRLAFRVSGKDYGGVNKLLRDMIQKEEWLENGSWACIIECPGGMKSDLISRVAKRSSGLDVK